MQDTFARTRTLGQARDVKISFVSDISLPKAAAWPSARNVRVSCIQVYLGYNKKEEEDLVKKLRL